MDSPLPQLRVPCEDAFTKDQVGRSLHQILVLGRDLRELEEFPCRFVNGTEGIRVHPTRRIGEALFALAHGNIDAVLCMVEAPEDVARILRCRKAHPRIPVLALVPQIHSKIAAICLQMGAQVVLAKGATLSEIVAALHAALANSDVWATGSIPMELPLAERELLGAFLDHSSARRTSTLLSRQPARAEGFQPLLVEDDPNQSLLFARALRRLGLCRRVPVAQSPGEAIAYLSGGGELSDRSRYPEASLVILDFHLGLETGEKVLRWLRGQPKLQKLPVVLFTSSQDPATLSSMVGLGINAHFVKPPSLDGLVRTIEHILDFWHDWNRQGQ